MSRVSRRSISGSASGPKPDRLSLRDETLDDDGVAPGAAELRVTLVNADGGISRRDRDRPVAEGARGLPSFRRTRERRASRSPPGATPRSIVPWRAVPRQDDAPIARRRPRTRRRRRNTPAADIPRSMRRRSHHRVRPPRRRPGTSRRSKSAHRPPCAGASRTSRCRPGYPRCRSPRSRRRQRQSRGAFSRRVFKSV